MLIEYFLLLRRKSPVKEAQYETVEASTLERVANLKHYCVRYDIGLPSITIVPSRRKILLRHTLMKLSVICLTVGWGIASPYWIQSNKSSLRKYFEGQSECARSESLRT